MRSVTTTTTLVARRFLVALAGVGGVAILLAGPAAAHIHPDPPAVQAGQPATVSFAVEHGCGDSPTTELQVQLPDGSTDASGVDAGGFTSSVSGTEVTFTGGTLAADEEGEFTVAFTPPATPGEVEVKILQTCEKGELAWIEPMGADGTEPEHPAPVLKLTAGAPTADDLAVEDDDDDEATSSDGGSSSDEHAGHHGGDEATTEAGSGDESAQAADTSNDDDSSTSVMVIGGIAAAAVVAGGGLLLARRGKGGSADS